MPTNKKSDAYERGTIQVPGQPKVPLDARSRQLQHAETPEKGQPGEPGPEPPSVAEAQGKARATEDASSAESQETAGGPTLVEPTDAETVAEAAALDGDPHVQLQMRMGEALRNQGINEQSVAAAYARVVAMLKNKTAGGSVDKVMLDILKECSKHLEEDSKAAGSAPIRVRLIHNVARPQRADVAPASSCPDDSFTNETENQNS